jgi:hypothetical protein
MPEQVLNLKKDKLSSVKPIPLEGLSTFIKGTTLIIGNANCNVDSSDDLCIVIQKSNLSIKNFNDASRLFYKDHKNGYFINNKSRDFVSINAIVDILKGNKVDTLIVSEDYNNAINIYSQFISKDTNIFLVNNKSNNFTPYNKNKDNRLSSIFQIYYNEETLRSLDPNTIPYINTSKDGYYENSVIQSIRNENFNSEYIGVTSPSQFKKTGLPLLYIEKLIQLNEGVDIFNYSPIIEEKFRGYDLWRMHKNNNSDVYKLANILNKSNVLPFDLFERKWVYNLGNYWVARKEIYDWYTDTVLTPTINFLDKNKLIFDVLKFEHKGNINHTSYAFLLEGLFGSFLANTQNNHQYVFDTFELIKMYNVKGVKHNKLISPEISIN